MPAEDRSLLMDLRHRDRVVAVALEVVGDLAGRGPGRLDVGEEVCHSVGFCAGSAAKSGRR